MPNNEPSPEKRIATDQTLLRLRGVEADELTPGVLLDVHDVFREHGLSLESTSIERRWRRIPTRKIDRFRY